MNSTVLSALADINRKLESIEKRLEAKAPGPAPMMTETQAAKLLNVKRQTLSAWRTQGRGPRFTKVGRSVRYAAADIEQYIQREGVAP